MLKMNAKRWTILLILVLASVSGWRFGYGHVWPQVLFAVVCAVGADVIFDLFVLKKPVFSESTVITGLIVAVLPAPESPLLPIALMSLFAIASKRLIRVDRRNVFNPAALGLLIGVLLFGARLSWWVDANHLLTILAGAVLFTVFSGRWRSIFAFLAVFIILIIARAVALGHPIPADLYLYVSISSFFVFFMLTDPRTSPLMPKDQPLFAAVVAVGSFLSVIFHPASIFLGGLLLADVLTIFLNRRSFANLVKMSKPAPPPAPLPSAPVPTASLPSGPAPTSGTA